MANKPTKAEMRPCVCLSCGQTNEALFWLREDGIPYQTARCPKCSNRAIGMSLSGFGYFMTQVAKEIVALKGDILDIQGAGDEER